MKLKRMTAALLLLVMLLSCLLLRAMAAPAADEGGENFFYLSAQTTSTSHRLLIKPVKVYYDADESIAQALLKSGYSFADLDEQYSKFISRIEGIEGNYTYCGDFPEAVTLREQACNIRYLYFSERLDAKMTPALQGLMQAAADYLCEDADVQAAAKTAYDEVLAQYPGQTDEDAAALTQTLTGAIRTYKNSLEEDLQPVTVLVSEDGCAVTAVNQYGREFTADGTTLVLPKGTYTICARSGNRFASRSDIQTPRTDPVSLALPTGNWFSEEAFLLSGTYESPDTESGSRFRDGLFDIALSDHTVLAQIPDAFSGDIYPYVAKAAGTPSDLRLTVSYQTAGGTAVSRSFTAASQVSSLNDTVRLGTVGNKICFCLSRETDGCTQGMELKLVLARVPTLRSLRVENAEGVVQAADKTFSPLNRTYSYRIVETSAVTLYPEAATAGSTIAVSSGGTPCTPASDGSVRVPVSGDTEITVTVCSGNYKMEYTLKLLPGKGKTVKFKMDTATSLTMVNKNGETLGYTSIREGASSVYTYTLVPGEEYSYIATKNTYFHTRKTFIADPDTDTGSTLLVEVNAGNWMSGLWLGSRPENAGKGSIVFQENAFYPTRHAYTAEIPDSTNALYAWFTSDEVYTCEVLYPCQSTVRGETPGCEKSLITGNYTGVQLTEALLSGSAYGNKLTFRLSQKDTANDVTNYVDYVVTVKRTLNLRDMTVSLNGTPIPLYRSDAKTIGYVDTETSYSVLVPAAAGSLDLAFQLHSDAPKYNDADTGYSILAGKRTVPANGQISVPLRGDDTDEIIRIVLTNRYAPDAKTEYTIRVRKAPTTAVHFDPDPFDALVYIYEQDSGNRVWPENNTFALCEGFTYRCTVTKAGYVGKSGVLTLTDGTLTFGETTYSDLSCIPIPLDQAEADRLDHNLNAQWPNFRGSSSNNAVTSAPTPIAAEEGTLYWAVKLGEGYSSGAVSSPILVNDELVVYAGNQIYRIDKDTGETIRQGTMAGTSDFAINGPTYADGMLLVGLSNGRIQAFDAVTLESLWLYADPLLGQSNCPITVCGDYAYTGFWNSESRDGSFVCLSLTDEDPSQTTEPKYASWRLVQNGGFYWAGAYVCENFIMVGTDDGEDSCSYLYLLDPLTGRGLDSKSNFNGDIRSTIAYDAQTDAYYFTSKGGSFYRVKVGQQDGGYAITGCDELKLTNGSDDPATPPMSTSTPVIYNYRAYIGVSGTGQFTPYSGHSITVIDLSDTMSIAYRVLTQGYPQTSGLLTTAYEKQNDYVYVYFFDNHLPGTLRVLRDSAGQQQAAYLTIENYKGRAYDTPHALFTPVNDQAQYAICSPIADENGTIYFKNDSAYLMAFGSALELNGMTVTTMPDRTEYEPGDVFDPTGLTVKGVFVNGVERDVTKMLSFPKGKLQAGDTAASVEFGRTSDMYHNRPAANGQMEAGVSTKYAALEIPITVTIKPVVNEIGPLTCSYTAYNGKMTITGDFDGQTLIAACYDGNGRMMQVQTLDKAGDLTLNTSSAKIRLFLLDKDRKPVCAAVTVKG